MALLRRSQRSHELFPGFTDVAEIGVGSLAVVFRAREIGTNRHVALKLLNVRDASPRSIESFERESIALGALSSHPNIVTLYRVFRTPDGRPVLVLELCTGGAVYDRLHDGEGLPVAEAMSVGIKIAGALETAHRGGILHRDVKPQNILITDFGEPALADFGVAMLQSATQTTAGLFDFTTLHAAPELLEGGGTSAATDVYELASSLYQLIAGQSAFRAYEGESPASVILRILRDPVRPLSGQDVPMELSDLLIRAMSKQMDKRPTTAAEFAAELADVEIAQGWSRTQFLIRDPGPLDTGLGPTITRLPDDVPRGLPSTLAPNEPIVAMSPGARVAPVPSVAGLGWTPPAPDSAPARPLPLPAAAPEPPADRAPIGDVPVPPAHWAPPPPPADAPAAGPPPDEPAEPSAVPVQLAPTDWDRFAPPAVRGRRRVPVEIDEEYLPVAGSVGGGRNAADYAPRHGPAEAFVAESPAEPVAEQPPPAVAEQPQPAPVPVWAVRSPIAEPVQSGSPAFVSDLSLEPMSLRPRATLRAGASAVTITEQQLRLRTWFKRSSIEWADVEGFEAQLDSADAGPAPTGQIIALTTLGPVELPGTRRPVAELRYVHALLAAYRIRAQRIANR